MKRFLLHSRYFSTPSRTGSELQTAYESAQDYFKIVQSKATDPLQVRYSDPTTHEEFQKSQVDLMDPVYSKMYYNRWRRHVKPKLLNSIKKHGIVGHVLPEPVEPLVNFELNFTNTKWLGAYGHAIPANWALYSPSITITTNDERQRYFTLLMMDIDKPNTEEKKYSEWCHWLVYNIPVQYRAEIQGGSSPFLLESQKLPSENQTGMGFVPTAPLNPPNLPGTVLLDYIPPHPPLSNPRNMHRYFFGLIESNTIGSQLDVSKMSDTLKSIQEKSSRPELQMSARFHVGPFYKFIKDHDANLVGYGLFTSVWNTMTPEIYQRLGIHEPVFGSIRKTATKSPESIKESIDKAARIVAKANNNLSELSETEWDCLNKGVPLPLNSNPTILQTRNPLKTPRLTVIGAAGYVKAREESISPETSVEVSNSKTVVKTERKYRYANV